MNHPCHPANIHGAEILERAEGTVEHMTTTIILQIDRAYHTDIIAEEKGNHSKTTTETTELKQRITVSENITTVSRKH
jgi:hypothetical protein